MKHTTVLALFSFLFLSLVGGDESQKVKIPQPGTLEFYQLISGTYEVVFMTTNPMNHVATLSLKDERGMTLDLKQGKDFTEKFRKTTMVKIETTELPYPVLTEKRIHLKYIGRDKWGLETFRLEADCIIKVPLKEEEKKKKPPVLNPGPMLTTTPPRAGFFI